MKYVGDINELWVTYEFNQKRETNEFGLAEPEIQNGYRIWVEYE